MVRIIISTLFFSLFFSSIYSQKIENDVKTTQAVIANTAAQTAIEKIHNIELDSVLSKKKKIAEYTAKMKIIKDLYRMSMQNIDGFGQESQVYKSIASTTAQILTNAPIAIKELLKRPYSSVVCIKEISELSLEAKSLVNTFVNVVNNGKISFKVKDLQIQGADDGYNYINRTDRMIMANDILTRLIEINYKLEGVIYLSRFCNGINDIVRTLDIDSWCAYFSGKNQIENIIRLYHDL